jgi:hypothetical protein
VHARVVGGHLPALLIVEFEQILTRVEDRVLTITLNRPDRLNA